MQDIIEEIRTRIDRLCYAVSGAMGVIDATIRLSGDPGGHLARIRDEVQQAMDAMRGIRPGEKETAPNRARIDGEPRSSMTEGERSWMEAALQEVPDGN